jgi:cell shape-determining protein MreC
MLKKIENLPGFVKNTETGVILNTNSDEIKAAKLRKKAMQEKNNRIDSLESEVKEVKDLLYKVLEKLDGNNNF